MRFSSTIAGVLVALCLSGLGLSSCTTPSSGGGLGGAAAGLETAQITVEPSTLGLPDGPTTLAVSGSGLRPSTRVAILQCTRPFGDAASCLTLADHVEVASTGTFGPTSVTVTFLIDFSGTQQPCSSSGGDACFLSVQYEDTGDVAGQVPLVFLAAPRS